MKKAKELFEDFINNLSEGKQLSNENASFKDDKQKTKIIKKQQQKKDIQKITTNLQCVMHIKQEWKNILYAVFETKVAQNLFLCTKPVYIENNILHVQVKQADEQFFLTMKQQEIVDYLHKQNSTFFKNIQKITPIQYVV